MSNFTEFSTAEEIIKELDEYIPCLDEDKKYLKKYRNDFIYHFRKGFYNLALFSFHYLYMFVVSTSMVKYYSFNKNDVINQSGHNHDLNIELFAYFGKESEKNTLKSIQRNILSKEIKSLHSNNVSKRDNIAHSSGITITLTEFIAYINNCFSVLKAIQPIVLLKCYERTTIKQKWDDVNYDILDAIWENNQDSFEELIKDFLIDYYLCYKDMLYIDTITNTLNAIKFLRQFLTINAEGEYSLMYNEELDLHHSIFDNFTSKYQSAFSTNDDNLLSNQEIINFLKELDSNESSFIAYNVYDKLMEMSKYWVPFGTQKVKEFLNV